MKNGVLLPIYVPPSVLAVAVGRCVMFFNEHRSHESRNTRTPASVSFDRAQAVRTRRAASTQQSFGAR